MYASRTTQLLVGIFALLGIAVLGYLSLRLGLIELLPAPGYTIYADFDNISGLKVDDGVEISGVRIGKVTEIFLKENRARVAMRIEKGIQIDDGAIAAIKTTGLLGDKYISIALDSGTHSFTDGDSFRHTQSAFVLEDAIGELINRPSGQRGNK